MKTPLIGLVLVLIMGFSLDLFVNPFIQLISVYLIINMILSMSLNLVNGFTGQFSLGHAGFMALGAYISAYLSKSFVPFGDLQYLNFAVYTWSAGFGAAFAGYLVGLPSLRLKGDYLAIVTLGFAEIIRVMLINTDTVGGPRGYSSIPGLEPWTTFGVSGFMSLFLYASLWALICFFTIWRLVYSSHGRSFLSVREDEIAAESMGIDTTSVKVRAFVISSFFAGVAGSVFAHTTNYLNPSSFGFIQSVNVVIMVVLGGMGSITGSIIGAGIVTILPELLRPLQEITGVDLRMVIYSLVLILMMILRPTGIFGELELSDLWRKYARKS
jgi:branched-chain amino acid transport system permease protein